jgi:hypothetical protein
MKKGGNMKHCDKCDVDIADNIKYCPLCGRNIDDNLKDDEQSFLSYPNNKIWINKRKFAINLLIVIAIIGTVITTGVDLFFNHTLSYSWYVITGFVLFMMCIALPIKKRWCFSAVSTVVGVSVCFYILFIELYTQTFGWGLIYAIPFFLLFMCLNCVSIIFSRNYYKGFEFVVPLIIFTILSIVLFIVNSVLGFTIWPSLVVFATSLASLAFVLIFRFKQVKKELERSFFV